MSLKYEPSSEPLHMSIRGCTRGTRRLPLEGPSKGWVFVNLRGTGNFNKFSALFAIQGWTLSKLDTHQRHILHRRLLRTLPLKMDTPPHRVLKKCTSETASETVGHPDTAPGKVTPNTEPEKDTWATSWTVGSSSPSNSSHSFCAAAHAFRCTGVFRCCDSRFRG